MKSTPNYFYLFSLVLLTLLSCREEEIIVPTLVNLSNNSIYELLPANSNVAILSTDDLVVNPSFRLVNGEGASDNGDFVIKGTILQTSKVLRFANGASRSIRVQVTAETESFEQIWEIKVNQFVGTYPTVISPSFGNNEEMPRNFGMDNGNVSPDLVIMDVPDETVSMVIAMVDLDDGNSFHWVLWNIPPDKVKFQPGESSTLGGNIVVGDNSFGTGYTGPFPPTTHNYQITVYFLSDSLNLNPDEFLTIIPAMTGKIIAQASIVGKYSP